MKQHPYLAMFLMAWLLALPAVFIHYPKLGFVAKIFAGSLRGVFPMLAGWATLYLSRQRDPRLQLERAGIAVTFVSIIFFGLAVWAAGQPPSA